MVFIMMVLPKEYLCMLVLSIKKLIPKVAVPNRNPNINDSRYW
jgi:hypothetical protein